MTNDIALTPEILLKAYQIGIFPMAEGAGSEDIYWYDPDPRGVMPIHDFHVPRRLRTVLNRADYQIKVNSDFVQTMSLCGSTRTDTWINQELIDCYTVLHQHGFVHSLEVWREAQMVGGIYGVHIGQAFFGESMFSTQTNMSKVALTHLTARLWAGGFTLFDTQFLTSHLAQFGAFEMAQDDYKQALVGAIQQPVTMLGDQFTKSDYSSESDLLSSFLQDRTQTS